MSRTAQSASARVKRTPVGQRQVLSVTGKEDGYVYRIVNDQGSRISDFIDGGYGLVEAADVRVGDKRVNSATPEGSKAQVSVGKGEKAFVMRIKREYYEEDQRAKQAEIDRLEQSMKQTAQGADYGTVSIGRGTV